MQNRPRTVITLKKGLSLTCCLSVSLLASGIVSAGANAEASAGASAEASAGQETSPAGSEIIIDITNLRNAKGTIRACMTDDPDRFPRCRDDAGSHRLVIPAGQGAQLHFRNVAPGTYAIALLHDENDNGRADRALTMIPREGFGFSLDAPVRLGPPDFEDAAFAVGTTGQQHTIRMRYML